jgi:hypothetical protein
MGKCELCGEPLPAGEEMFKYHGYSGDCPKPPIQKTEVMVEYIFRDMRDGEFWIDVTMNREPYMQIGPFETAAERQRAHDDLMAMTRSLGAKDLPNIAQ